MNDARSTAPRMRFGIGVPAGAEEQFGDTYLDAASRWCELAESLGFDFVTLPHHRFTPGYPLGSPWVTLAALAARTSSMHLGTAIFLLPLDHPLGVAEEIATLDQLSGGRAFLGAGLGYRRYEWDALQLPYERRGTRMTEALEIIQAALARETVEHHGEHFDFDPVTVYPRPVQRPRPRIWVGANGPAGVRRATKLADAWIVGFGDRLDTLAQRAESFRAESAANGRDGEICLMRLVGIGASRDQVEHDWLPAVLAMLRSYRRAGAPGERDEQASRQLRAQITASSDVRPSGLDALAAMAIAGSPNDVIEGVRRYRETTGCEHFIPTIGGPDPVRALELFGREVIPAFR